MGSEERPVDGGTACAPVPAPLRPAVSFPAPARSWHSGAAENAEPMSMWKPSLKGAGRRPRALPLGPPGRVSRHRTPHEQTQRRARFGLSR